MAASGFGLAVISLLTTVDVCLSNFTGRPITGVFEVVETSLAFLVFLGLPAIFLTETNITVDVIDHFVPPAVAALLKRTGAALSFVFLGLMGYSMVGPAVDAVRFGDVKPDSHIPMWIPWSAVLAGTALAMLAIALSMVRRRRESKEPGP